MGGNRLYLLWNNFISVSYHFYEDDTQLYFKISEKDKDYQKLTDIGLEIKNWTRTRKLKLNANKTEMILIGSRIGFSRLNFDHETQFLGTNLNFTSYVRNIGFIFDKDLSMRDRVGYVSAPPFGRWTFRRRTFGRRDYLAPKLFF